MQRDDRILFEHACRAGSSSPFSCLRSSSSGAFPATPTTTGPGRSRPTCRRSSWAPATAQVRTSSHQRLLRRAGTPSRSASCRPRSSPRSFSSSCGRTGTGYHGDGPFGAVFAFYGWVIVYGAAPFVVGGCDRRSRRNRTAAGRDRPGRNCSNIAKRRNSPAGRRRVVGARNRKRWREPRQTLRRREG